LNANPSEQYFSDYITGGVREKFL